MSVPATKLCRICGITKPVAEMTTETKARNGKVYVRGRCKGCDNNRRSHEPNLRAHQQSALAHQRRQRAAGEEPDKYIHLDAKGSDRKKGFENDLTREFIREQIKDGCSYCGETEIRMTLDRIDNDRGHTQDNVVPACIRCNYTRRNMPHEAWLVVARGMQEAREGGLFGDWTGRARRSGTKKKKKVYKGSPNPSADARRKLTQDQVSKIRALYAGGGQTQTALAKHFGVTQANISRIVRGEGWVAA